MRNNAGKNIVHLSNIQLSNTLNLSNTGYKTKLALTQDDFECFFYCIFNILLSVFDRRYNDSDKLLASSAAGISVNRGRNCRAEKGPGFAKR